MSELTDRGNLLFSQHRFELAADVFRRALQEAPNDAYAHARLALCFAALEKTKEAYTEAHSAIAASPNYAYAHYALALVYDSDGRRAESENAVLVAIHHDPWKSYYFALLARARLLQNKAGLRNRKESDFIQAVRISEGKENHLRFAES